LRSRSRRGPSTPLARAPALARRDSDQTNRATSRPAAFPLHALATACEAIVLSGFRLFFVVFGALAVAGLLRDGQPSWNLLAESINGGLDRLARLALLLL
jgi:hypothetical protein